MCATYAAASSANSRRSCARLQRARGSVREANDRITKIRLDAKGTKLVARKIEIRLDAKGTKLVART